MFAKATWELGLEMLEEMVASIMPVYDVLTDSVMRTAMPFHLGLETRDYVIGSVVAPSDVLGAKIDAIRCIILSHSDSAYIRVVAGWVFRSGPCLKLTEGCFI